MSRRKSKSIQKISEAELDSGIFDIRKSWHNDYKDQAYVYIGGLNKKLTEADILAVFSQYGVPVDIHLMRDSSSGESKGFAYLKYEDQRSTVLAVDNLNGVTIGGRTLTVDHTFYEPHEKYKNYRKAVEEELSLDKM